MNFIPLRPARILSQFLGEAEKALSDLFSKARNAAPSLIFLDEIDTLAPRRSGKDAHLDRLVAQLLTEMDGLSANHGITVIAATNRPQALDPALTRPGRFDVVIELPLPDLAGRRAILEVHSRGLPLQDVDLFRVAEACPGASGAELANLVTTASRISLRRCLAAGLAPHILHSDFAEALSAHAARAQALAEDHLERR